MAINETYSNQAYPYHDLSFKDRPAEEFNNTEIRNSCFYQEWVDDGPTMKDIFPDGMVGVTFIRCNLDNVHVPPGNVIGPTCTHKRFRVQNDMATWVVDENDKPVEPKSKHLFEMNGYSTDPKDIPQDFVRREEIPLQAFNRLRDDPEFVQWWDEVPVIVDQKVTSTETAVPKELWDRADTVQWLQDYDVAPAISIERRRVFRGRGHPPEMIDCVVLRGAKTLVTIEGKGKFLVSGKKSRPCLNQCEPIKKLKE